MRRGNQTWEGLKYNIYNVLLSNGSISPYLAEYEFTNMEDVPDKGNTNSLMSRLIFERLNEAGIDTHFAGVGTTPNSLIIWKCTIAQMKIVVRNISTEEFCEMYKGKIKEGTTFKEPVIEFFQINGNPISTAVLLALKIISMKELAQILVMMERVNDVATKFFDNLGLTLVEFEAEVGWDYRKELVLAGAFTQDTCTLWDTSGDDIDKDVFKKSKVLDEQEAVYRKMMQLLKKV